MLSAEVSSARAASNRRDSRHSTPPVAGDELGELMNLREHSPVTLLPEALGSSCKSGLELRLKLLTQPYPTLQLLVRTSSSSYHTKNHPLDPDTASTKSPPGARSPQCLGMFPLPTPTALAASRLFDTATPERALYPIHPVRGKAANPPLQLRLPRQPRPALPAPVPEA